MNTTTLHRIVGQHAHPPLFGFGRTIDTPAEQFAAWLPYSAYLAAEKLFVNRDSLGFMLELMPQSGADERMAEVLISLYANCGDYIVFAFDGEAQRQYPGLHGQPFFKIVRGLPGDTVTVNGRVVAVNGEVVGTAKIHAFDRRPLDPIAATVIPAGHYYVQGTSPDSFDSRYRASGLVRADQVLGTVIPLF